jgi:hypothetical protein
MHALNHTHDVHARSWVESANPTATHSSDFPIQNLPFGRFRAAAAPRPSASASPSATRCSTCAPRAWSTATT